MSEPTNADLAETLRRLETRMEVIARPYEDALADRLFTQTRDRLYKYIGLALIFVVPALGFVGFQSWKDLKVAAEERATKSIQDAIDKTVPATIRGRIEPMITKATGEVEEIKKRAASVNSSTYATNALQEQTDLKTQYLLEDLNSKFEAQLAIVRHNASAQTDKLVEEFNKRVERLSVEGAPQLAKIEITSSDFSPVPTPDSKPQTDGWTYYGLYANGKWTRSNFANQNKTKRGAPAVGDKVVVVARTNARVDMMTYQEQTGWHMAPIKGLLEPGTVITVRDLQKHDADPGSAHYWVRFDDATKPLGPRDAPISDYASTAP